uniref:Uncharacterized protein n=1 Tax=Leersia perrieri TaxID=77586 RepID=A0A0D9V489_9ORYZ
MPSRIPPPPPPTTRSRSRASHLAPAAAAAEEGGEGEDGALQRVELPPQELRARIPRLPGVREPSWADQEVRAHVLQAVLPQQRQGHWLHQEDDRPVPSHCQKIGKLHPACQRFFVLLQ